LPHFLNNIAIRLIWIVEILMYHYGWIDFESFIFLFVLANAFGVLVLMVYLLAIGEMKLSFQFFSLRRKVFKVVLKYGLYTIVAGISTLLVKRIDIIMITFLMDLSSTSVYSIAFYISSVIAVPSRSIGRIARPIVSEQWRKKKMDDMLDFYKKSSINALLAGGFVFLCIWGNIDDIFLMLPAEYAAGKWAVLFLSLAVLYNMITGINGVIILNSNYYMYDGYASIALSVLTIATNLIFIPMYGVLGAALATLISIVSYHTYKFVLILVKMKMQPFTGKTILGILVTVVVYALLLTLPVLSSNYLLQIIIKCFITAVVFWGLAWKLNISSEVNEMIEKVFSMIKKKFLN